MQNNTTTSFMQEILNFVTNYEKNQTVYCKTISIFAKEIEEDDSIMWNDFRDHTDLWAIINGY